MRTSRQRWWRRTALMVAVLLAWTTTGCNEPLSFEREQVERGSFGEELYRILHKDLVRSPEQAEAKGLAFEARRDDFVLAVDTTLPAEDLTPVDELLVRMKPLYDNEMLPDLIRKMGFSLETAAERDALMEAFEREEQLPELLSHPERAAFILHALSYEDAELGAGMAELNDLLIDVVRENSTADSDAFRQIIRSLAREMRLAEVEGGDRRLERILMRVMLTEDPAFAPEEAYEPVYAVRLDERGVPQLQNTDLGTVPFPFGDADEDGLGDLNEARQFLDFDGELYEAPPFGPPGESVGRLERDDTGRLRNFEGDGYAYAYVDLHATVLGLLMRDTGALAADDVPFDLVRAFQTALGEAENQTDGGGSYLGYPSDNPLTRLAIGGLTALDHPAVPGLLEGSAILLREHPEALARVLLALEQSADELDAFPGALTEDANLVDELLPLMLEVAQTPGLLEDVLVALEDPISDRTGEALATMMTYRKDFISVVKDGTYDACFHTCKEFHEIGTLDRYTCIRECPSDMFETTVDRSAPESASNRSLFERALALIWESGGVEYRVGVTELEISGLDLTDVAAGLGDMLVFEDMGEAYVKSIAGDLVLSEQINPALLEGELFQSVSGLADALGLDITPSTVSSLVIWLTENGLDLTMDENPTPDQLTRFFNKDPLEIRDASTTMVMNMAICRSGRRCIDAHADTLLALEASGAVDTLYPLAVAFSSHDRADLLVKILAAVYEHYPAEDVVYTDSDGDPLPLAKSDIASLEEGLISVLEKDLLLGPLSEFGAVSTDIVLEDGSSFTSQLEGFLLHALTPDASLTFLDGTDSTFDPEGNIISPINPFYMLLEPARDLDDRLAADPEGEAAWDRAVGSVTDLMLEVEEDGAGGARFSRPASPLLAAVVVDELRELWLDAEAKGERSVKLREELPADIQDLISGRVLYNALALFDWMNQHSVSGIPARDLMRSTTLHLVEHEEPVAEQATLAVYGLLAGMQDEAGSVAALNLYGVVIDPDRTWQVPSYPELPLLDHGIELLAASREYDPDLLLIEILRQGLAPGAEGVTPLGHIWESVRQIHRAEPGADDRLVAADFVQIFTTTVDYLRDEERGGERLYDFVERAIHGPGGKPESDN